jgi:hypothetical protein
MSPVSEASRRLGAFVKLAPSRREGESNDANVRIVGLKKFTILQITEIAGIGLIPGDVVVMTKILTVDTDRRTQVCPILRKRKR